MPSIWTFGPENTTGVDLGANAFWRIMLGAVQTGSTIWMSVSLIYPPSAGQTIQQTQITLARAGIPVTDRVDDVMRIAQVSISTGSRDGDKGRMTEAFNLFKNNGKAKQEIVEIALRDGLKMVEVYWDIRDWLTAGAMENRDVTALDYTIKLIA
jgi:hypothetical protein